MNPMGSERSRDSKQNTRVSNPRGNKSGNTGSDPGADTRPTDLAAADPDLAAVIAAWATLPSAIRAGVLALVRAGGSGA